MAQEARVTHQICYNVQAMLLKTSLPDLPAELPPKNVFCGIEFSFRVPPEKSELHVTGDTPDNTTTLLANFFQLRSNGAQFIERNGGHGGYFAITAPYPDKLADREPHARLHIAVSYVTYKDLVRGRMAEYRRDADLLLDLVQKVLGEMVEAGALKPGIVPVEIITEPLTPKGRLRPQWIDRFSEDIGISWLTDGARKIFSSFRWWNSKKGGWQILQ